jgi:TonB family protein
MNSQILTWIAKSCWAFSFLTFVFALSPSAAAAPRSPVSQLSAVLKHYLTENKVRSVVVADFTDSAGKLLPEGIYFADLLDLYLAEPPRKFALVGRDRLGHELQQRKLSPADLTSPETARLLCNSIPVDAVVYGTVNTNGEELLLRASVRRASDLAVIASEQISLQQSEFYRSLVSYPNYLTPREVFGAGEKGINFPECEDCPAPQFRSTADARTDRSRTAAVLLGLVITEEGRVANVKVLQGAGPEFTDMAWRAVRAFRFKPARNKAGENVAAAIPMQVFFSVIVDD